MFPKTVKNLPALFFAAAGVIYLLTSSSLLSINVINYSYLTFAVFGLAGVFVYIGNDERPLLIISSVVFIYSVYMYIPANFELLNKTSFPFPVLLIISATAFFMLYLDNTSEKVFLFISASLIIISLLLFRYNGFWLVRFGNSLCEIIYSYWYVFLIFIGTNLLLSNRK